MSSLHHTDGPWEIQEWVRRAETLDYYNIMDDEGLTLGMGELSFQLLLGQRQPYGHRTGHVRNLGVDTER